MVKKDYNLVLIIFSILLLFLDYFGWLAFVKNPAESAILPLKQVVFGTKVNLASLGELIWRYPQLEKIIASHDKLEKDKQELTLKVRLLTEENSQLRSQLEAPLPASYQFIPAPVIATSRFMELGVGRRDGVGIGMMVVDGSTLLGKIVAVSEQRSSVMLLVDSEIMVPAKTSRSSRGMVVGQGGEEILLTRVLQKDPLFLDDVVTTSGEEGFPPNLIIGRVVHINSDDVSVYKQAKLKPDVDYWQKQMIFVISAL